MTDLTSLCSMILGLKKGLLCHCHNCHNKLAANSHRTVQENNVCGAHVCPGLQSADIGHPCGGAVAAKQDLEAPTRSPLQPHQAVAALGTETHAAAASQTCNSGATFSRLLAAAQHHGAQGPAARLHIAAVATAAVNNLQRRRNCSQRYDHDGDAEALRKAVTWLADISTDDAVSEPSARAALSAMADVLTAALKLLLQAPSAVAAATAARAAAPTTVDPTRLPPAAAAAMSVLYEPRCNAVRLTAAAITALYGRCPDAAAVAAAARLLGCCLQLQIKLLPPLLPTPPTLASCSPPLQPPPSPPHLVTGMSPTAVSAPAAVGESATVRRDGAVAPAARRSVYLSEAVGWGPLLDLQRHPHPLVRTACLGAVQQACAAAAETTPDPNAAAAAVVLGIVPPPTLRHLLDPAAAAAAYAATAACLEDDAEEIRAAAISLASTLATRVPELPYGTHFGVAVRLVDDVFMRLCALVADPHRGLRLQAVQVLGGLHAASLRVKLQALSKKTTLRVAVPAPVSPPTVTAAAAPDAGAVGASVVKPGGKRPAADVSAVVVGIDSGGGNAALGGGAGIASSPKRITTAAWESQSWLGAAKVGSGSESGSASGPGGGGGGGGSTRGYASDDLTLLENAVGAFVLGSEDEHWEVRVATLDAMTRLAEHEYRAAAAAAITAAAADLAASATEAPAGTSTAAALEAEAAGRGGGMGGGRGPGGSVTAGSLSVRIGGIGGTAGSRIASGGGNVEAAAAICEALIDALLDELPEVRRAAARGVGCLLKLEAQALVSREMAVTAAAARSPPLPSRRSLPPLLTEELIRALLAAARDTDCDTRREVIRALGRIRLSRPGLLREVVQVLRRCIAANPSAPEWREAAAAAWRLGAAAPAAAAASMRDLAPPPQELMAPSPPLYAAAAATIASGNSGLVRNPGQEDLAIAGDVPSALATLRNLRSDTVLRLLVLAGAHAVHPDTLAAALPPHLSCKVLVTVGRMYRP